jgi:hypothetical protein
MIDREGIQKALLKNKNLADTVYAGTISGENKWLAYDSTLESFSSSFYGVLPTIEYSPNEHEISSIAYSFKRYIENTLSENREQGKQLTAVEFGGPASNLFRGFTQGFFSKTAGVCLKDMRTPTQIEIDGKVNHLVIEGDVLNVKDGGMLFKNIREQLQVQKVNLIISRMVGPLHFIDKNLSIFDRIFRDWYDLLEENGIMFIENGLENKSRIEQEKIKKWQKIITTKFPQIDLKLDNDFGIILIHKGIGSPEHLPPAIKILKNN